MELIYNIFILLESDYIIWFVFFGVSLFLILSLFLFISMSLYLNDSFFFIVRVCSFGIGRRNC